MAHIELNRMSDEAIEDERLSLVESLKDIDLQLADRNRTERDGGRANSDSYNRWRMTALKAKRLKERRMSEIKRVQRERRQDSRQQRADLLAALFPIVSRAIFGGFVPTEEEQSSIDELVRLCNQPATLDGV